MTASSSRSAITIPLGRLAAFVVCLVAFFTLFYRADTYRASMEGFRLGASAALGVILLVSLQLLSQGLRFFSLLPIEGRPGLVPILKAFFWGQLANGFIPARAGDVLKAVYIHQDSESEASIPKVAGALVSDKLIDLLSIVLLGIILVGPSLLDGFSNRIWTPRELGMLASILLVLGVIGWSVRTRIQPLVVEMGRGLKPLKNPAIFLRALTFGLLAWVFEAQVLSLLASPVAELTMAQALVSLILLNLATAVPVVPGNVGAFEAGLAFGLTQAGIPWESALVIAVVHHLVQLSAPLPLAMLASILGKLGNNPKGVSEEDKRAAIEFYSSKATHYETNVNKGFLSVFRERERNAMLALSEGFFPGRTGIDVGCGAGFYASQMKGAHLRVTAVDISPEMVKAVEKVSDETIVGDIDSLELDRKFDWVVCAGVLDFVSNPEKAFSVLANLVDKDGNLLILCPRRGVGGFYYRIEKRVEAGIKVNLYTLSWFRNHAKAHGLELERVLFPLPTNMAMRFHRPK